MAKREVGITYLDRVVIEAGRTVRAALRGWPETIRLCVLVAVVCVFAMLLMAYG
jgi:pyrimidine operon attenuation protein/uracil phosphoribosyltransferase